MFNTLRHNTIETSFRVSKARGIVKKKINIIEVLLTMWQVPIVIMHVLLFSSGLLPSSNFRPNSLFNCWKKTILMKN